MKVDVKKTQKWYSFDIYILHDLKTQCIYKQMGGANVVKPHPLNNIKDKRFEIWSLWGRSRGFLVKLRGMYFS